MEHQQHYQVRELFADEIKFANPSLMDKLIAQEKVHTLGQATGRNPPEDLLQRMAENGERSTTARKRAFALYHESDSSNPVFVVYAYMDRREAGEDGKVAQKDFPCHMRDILLGYNGQIEDTNIAVCYSISNLDPKLAKEQGLNGGMLLSGVYEQLNRQRVSTIVTLSPLEGLERWLEDKATKASVIRWLKEQDPNMDTMQFLNIQQSNLSASLLDGKAQRWLRNMAPEGFKQKEPIEILNELYKDEHYNALSGENLEKMNDILRKVGRVYLFEAVQAGKPHTPFDGVQKFHQGNGAEIAKLTPQRDAEHTTPVLATHPDGKSQNRLNVSYEYVPERQLEVNSKALKSEGKRAANNMVQAAHANYAGRLEAQRRMLGADKPGS